MLSFKEDANLPFQVITTFNGEQEYRKLCAKIKGEFYVKNKDCFEIDKTWYRQDSGIITKDFETGVWFIKDLYNSGRLNGIVDFKDGKHVLGYFTPNPYNNVLIQIGIRSYYVINTDLLFENGFIEDISNGTWCNKKDLSDSQIRAFGEIQNKINYNNKGYNLEDNVSELVKKKDYYEKYNVSLTKDVRRYSKFLNDTSWGIEIECAKGFLPDRIQNRTGIVVCHDGSLKDGNGNTGPEFVTIPLSGAKGLQTTVNISNELKHRSVINDKCSLHVHFGNIATSRLSIVSLYVLGYKIQDEIFKMFPYYKSNFEEGAKLGKEKDYCQKLKKMNMGILKDSSREEYERYINDNYIKIFYWLSQNQLGSGYNPSKEWNRKNQSHPVAQKWHRKNRYYWLNLMNILFSNRGTAEFRIHTPTVNSQKILNWLFICNAILRYAVLHSREILMENKKITLNNVLDYYKDVYSTTTSSFLSDYLKAYVKERTEYFQEDYKKGDYFSKAEMDNDKNYEFQYGNIKHLF